jgi:small-conductance mechanosensitive channel
VPSASSRTARGVLCAAMRAPDPRIAESLWHREWFSAALSLGVAFAIATAFDRALRGRIVRAAAQRTGISREADTRLRFVRRLIYATIVLIGVAVALSYFASIGRLAASLLASGAIAAAVVGFAARQVLANFVAGIMLAITQPLRVGDWVTFEGNYGVVEDVRLNYTILRSPSEARILIPNERLAGSVLRNDTLVVEVVSFDVAVWLPPHADADRAVRALEDETQGAVTIAEAVPWGVRLSVAGPPVAPADKGGHEAELRARCLRRLRTEGLLESGE